MNIEWLAIRGSGLVAYALLAGATIWGLLVSTKVMGSMKAKQVTWFHESLSIGALLATGVHMYALSFKINSSSSHHATSSFPERLRGIRRPSRSGSWGSMRLRLSRSASISRK